MEYKLATSTWGKEEEEAIINVVNKGLYTMGAKTRELEDSFSQFFGTRYSLMVNSGSSANLIALAALFYTKNPMLQPGDEVIVPAISWSTTYAPISQLGLKMRIVDVNPHTLVMDADVIEQACTEKTKAIFAVNLLGNSCEYEKIKQICEQKRLVLLEDNCESMGAIYNGKYAGTFGILGTFSSFFSHHICTIEGGFVVTDNKSFMK